MTRREVDQKFDEIVDFAEIEKFIDTPFQGCLSVMRVPGICGGNALAGYALADEVECAVVVKAKGVNEGQTDG